MICFKYIFSLYVCISRIHVLTLVSIDNNMNIQKPTRGIFYIHCCIRKKKETRYYRWTDCNLLVVVDQVCLEHYYWHNSFAIGMQTVRTHGLHLERFDQVSISGCSTDDAHL
jgi:hypothetical protein